MTSHRTLDRKIWDIAWPAILSNISIPLLGLVDSAILGHLDNSQYLGAVAVGAAILSFLYWGFSFLRMGTTGPVALAEGAGNQHDSFLVLFRSSAIALVIAAGVLLFHAPLLALGMGMMAPAPELAPLTDSYMNIRILSAPAVLLTYTVVGWCIGRQDTRWPLLIVVATNLTNIALDFLFVMGLGLNSDGAAMATVIAEYLGCALALYTVWRHRHQLNTRAVIRDMKIVSAYRLILSSNRYLFVRTICLLFSFAFFTAAGENFGTDTLAANTLMIQLLLIGAYGMDGFAYAAEGLTGNRLGAGDLPGFYRVVARCTLWTAVSAGTVSVALVLFEAPLLNALTSLDSVKELIGQYYLWLVVLPLLAAPSYLLDGVFIGSAQTRHMMTTMLISTLGVYLPLWYLTTGWGNHGLWLSFAAFNLARGITLYACYRQVSQRHAWQAAVH
ncbi:MATE family efflux transporter [Halioglobus sp. HI00S01]|uniref:MATE family efflux transporter n=1 Tax=Halioglobus sp. HI00S01 TaxID=1822214 RepID=UPI0007C4068F|nr:MATE family efflux transporter [Halioglobus sp. HI00S01]KZX58140.1 MATE family efflux transporter [Halioglobus sp. HI00S01]